MNIIYTLEEINPLAEKSIFLAGPTFRWEEDGPSTMLFEPEMKSWRDDALDYLEWHCFQGDVYVPEFRNNKKPEGWTYEKQITWELAGLNSAKCILFWIPRSIKNNLPAFTTNIEFGEWMHSNKISIGGPETADKNEYIKDRCRRLGIKWHDRLEATILNAMHKYNPREP